MSKAIETLAGADLAAFRAVLQPHVDALISPTLVSDANTAAATAATAAARAVNSVEFPTWGALAGATGMAVNDRATVLASDLGTHTDPVVGGTVNSAGVYQYKTSPAAGWQRIGNLDSTTAAAQTALATAQATTATTAATTATAQAGIATAQATTATTAATTATAQAGIATTQATTATTAATTATAQAGIATTQATNATTAVAAVNSLANDKIDRSQPFDRNVFDGTIVDDSGLGNYAGTVGVGGQVTTSVGDLITGYIPVTEGETYYLNWAITRAIGYNATKQSCATITVTTNATYGASFTVQSGANINFIRIQTTKFYGASSATIDLTRSPTRKQYKPFGLTEKTQTATIAAQVAGAHRGGGSKSSLLSRAAFNWTGTFNGNTGVFTPGTAAFTTGGITDLFPVSERTGVACSHDSNIASKRFYFYDKDGVPIALGVSTFNATFVAGSPNFTVNSYTAIGGLSIRPPSAPVVTGPIMVGMGVNDSTNNNTSIIPARTSVIAADVPFATTGAFTMSANAAASGTIAITTYTLAGLPIFPPPGYGITQARATMFEAGSYNVKFDDFELFNFNFVNAAEQRNTGSGYNYTYQADGGHYNAVSYSDIELERPLAGRKGAIIGNSAFAQEVLTKTFSLKTRSKLALRAALPGAQMHQFLLGCNMDGTSFTFAGAMASNWNFNTTNVNGVLTQADFAGLEYVLIGPLGGNEIGYGATTIGANSSGMHNRPYELGVLGDTLPVCVVNASTTAGSLTVTITATESGGAGVLVGHKFGSDAAGGLAGRSVTAIGTYNGSTGTVTVDGSAGTMTASGGWTSVGTFYGTLHWLVVTKLLAWSVGNCSATVKPLLPVLVTMYPRFGAGSANGGYTAGVYDHTNPGDPINSIGLRLSQYVDAVIAFGKLHRLPVLDLFGRTADSPAILSHFGYNGPAPANGYASDGLHMTETLANPIGSRAIGSILGGFCNRTFGMA